MKLDTYEAAVAGPCDFCPGHYEEGDLIAQPEPDLVMCPECLQEHRYMEAA